jgi:glycosyltransferase involved in cell wall biosynthesis
MNQLAVVLIAKDQEWNISRLIESVLDSVDDTWQLEVAVVDSASVDRTVDIACLYPVTVIRLHEDQIQTAAQGRYVGFENTELDPVLFLDGDMELLPGWIDRAVELLRSREDLAAVCGTSIHAPKGFAGRWRPGREPEDPEPEITEVQHAGGAALYRREVLRAVGSFNPSLFGEEEPELSLRIRRFGCRFLRLNRTMVVHYTDPYEEVATHFSRWKRNLFLGYGQVLRLHYNSLLILSYVRLRMYIFYSIFGLLLGVSSLFISLVIGNFFLVGLWVLTLAFLMIMICIRRRGLSRGISAVIKRGFEILGVFVGVFKEARPAGDREPRYDVVKEGPRI